MTMNERRAEIMRILTARRSITMPELARTFQVTTRTIQNDVVALTVDYPLETQQGKDELFGALRANGYGDLITETINAGSLSSFVKEQIAENEDVLPGWLDGLVNVFEKTTVGVRKAR